ncbi:MAG: nitrous oxide-stimulated promoter family protein [Prevotella sp.]|nr:nitrous oxide-stimulated promoter family protein [Prevotella sp.]
MKTRIDKEKAVVELMIKRYCHHNKQHAAVNSRQSGMLCDECSALLEYAHARLSHCKFGDNKPTCKKCPVHCYKPEMREKIRNVMRWSGPRMMIYHPIIAIKHMFQ